jgi:two-component system LytT family response regulator
MLRKIRAVIVDDENLARVFLRRMLREDADVEVVAECTNGREAVAVIQKEQPDVVFLDIQMPEMDGFSVVHNLSGDWLPKIVFTTAYEQYAIRAFEMHAIDYLLKPFNQVRFADMLRHVKDRIINEETTDQSQVRALLNTLGRKSDHLERLVIKNEGRFTFVKVAEISWLEADDKYVKLHVGKSTRTVRQTLNSMEAQLDPKRFTRIHRSAVVNIDRIREIDAMFNGEYELLLDDGTKLNVSRRYKDRLFTLLGKPL